MDLTVFQYITSLPDIITNETWYELAVRSYNLGLTCMWFLVASFIFDIVFKCIGKLYRKGHE